MNRFVGFATLVRFVLRRDRMRLAIWVIGTVLVFGISGFSLTSVYPDEASIRAYTLLFGDNPALVAFAGPGYGFDNPNIGVILVNETQLWGAITLAVMSVFLIGRYTRLEEDTERMELLLSRVVGRNAPLAAAVTVVAAAEVIVALLTTVFFIAAGYPTVGSIALVASMLVVGFVFIGVTALAAQIFSTNRAVIAAGLSVLLAAFILRAIGDIGSNFLTWISPIGWAQAVRAFAGERWWPLVLCAAVAGALVIVAFRVLDVRDLGSGVIGAQRGRAHAGALMRTPLGFALRMQRGALLIWIPSLFITGVIFGSIADDIDRLVIENPQLADVYAQLGDSDLTGSFFATAVMMLALLAGGFSVAAMTAPGNEERSGRADLLLARPLGRVRWMWSSMVVTGVGTTVLVLAAGLGMGVTYAAIVGDMGEIRGLMLASLSTVPACLVLTGLTVLVVGAAPRWLLAAWVPYAIAAVVGFFGELLRLPWWMRDLSPFHHLPGLPVAGRSMVSLVVLGAVAAATSMVGLWCLRRRDLAVA